MPPREHAIRRPQSRGHRPVRSRVRADRHPGGTGPAGSALGARPGVGRLRRRHRLAVEVPGDGAVDATAGRGGPTASSPIDAGDNAGAADADLVVIATPWDSARHRPPCRSSASCAARSSSPWPTPSRRSATSSSRSCRPRLGGRARAGRGARRARSPPRFHHVPAKELGDLDHPIESDVLICSDDQRGHRGHRRDRRQDPRLRPLDAGELSNATPIEAFTAVLLQLNVRYKTRVAPKFTGIPDAA